jgi:prepilin-type N-terminal cleavage/methylation domain-containing protein
MVVTMFGKHRTGFTLAELLIALAILGVIATFTIPKVLYAQQNAKYNAIAKEAMSTISAAYQQAQFAGIVSSSTTAGDLTPYMNFVATDTSTLIDDWQTGTTWGCDSSVRCLKLHNGAILAYDNRTFTGRPGSVAKDNLLLFQIDPDGVYSGTTNGPGKALAIVLYYDGGIGTQGNPRPNSNYSTWGSPSYEPPWFSW